TASTRLSMKDPLRVRVTRNELIGASLAVGCALSAVLTVVPSELRQTGISWATFLDRIAITALLGNATPLSAGFLLYLLFKALTLYWIIGRETTPTEASIRLVRVAVFAVAVLALFSFAVVDVSHRYRGEQRANFLFGIPNVLADWLVLMLPLFLRRKSAA